MFNLWWFFSIAANIVQIYNASLNFCTFLNVCSRNYVSAKISACGWSCFFASLNICQYFEYFPAYYSLFDTMVHGIASVGRFILSVVPVMLAFAFLGMCLFWKIDLFQGTDHAIPTLFALLNGDSIQSTFAAVYARAGFLGHIYLYAFIFFFIYIILNINITIIEEAYFTVALRKEGAITQPNMCNQERIPSTW